MSSAPVPGTEYRLTPRRAGGNISPCREDDLAPLTISNLVDLFDDVSLAGIATLSYQSSPQCPCDDGKRTTCHNIPQHRCGIRLARTVADEICVYVSRRRLHDTDCATTADCDGLVTFSSTRLGAFSVASYRDDKYSQLVRNRSVHVCSIVSVVSRRTCAT